MSVAVLEPPVRSEDRDAEFINYHEEFRRAKRNSLTWSAVVVVAALATPTVYQDGGEGSLQDKFEVFGTSIAVPQSIVVLMLLLAAVFFFASYLRSLAVVRPLNAQAATNEAEIWADILSIMKGIRNKLSVPDSEARAIERMAGDFKHSQQAFAAAETALDNELIRGVDASNFDLALSGFRNSLNTPGTSLRDIREYGEHLAEASASRFKQAGSAISQYKAAVSEAKETVGMRETETNDRLSRIEEKIDELESGLRKFRGRIGVAEKAWHYGLDWIAVIGLATVGIVLALWRLFDSDGLTAWLIRLS